tara:strand:+ start:1736 stop:2194 length:459 start_codon:yes stop_codon:yes gene_type:complete
MKEELQQKLFKNYPDLFAQKNLSIQESCMPWGICCGDGWFELIDLLCSHIQNRIKNVNRNIDYKLKENGPTLIPYNPGYLKCEVTQVKEKFGGLRFYVDCNDDYIDGLISLAEGMSYNTCSECGEKSSNQVKRGWIYTLCSPCRNKMTNEKK